MWLVQELVLTGLFNPIMLLSHPVWPVKSRQMSMTRSHCWTLNCKVELFLIENLKLRNVFCPFQKIFYSAFFPSDTFSYNPSISLSVSPLKYILSQSQFSILFTFSSSLSLSPSLFLSSLISYIFCNLLLLSLSFLLSVKVFLDNCRKQKSDVHVRLHI